MTSSWVRGKGHNTVVELHGPQAPTEGRLGLLGAVIAGTVTAGINSAAPTWVPLIFGIAARPCARRVSLSR